MDWQLPFLMLHLVGFALGLGGATVSDALFFKSLNRRMVTSGEVGGLHSVSRVIWVGILLSLISGAGFLYLMFEQSGSLPILASPRFQTKLTLIALVIINGLVFKFFVFPFLKRNADQPLSLTALGSKIWLLAVTGAVSIVSWYSILILSVLPRTFRPPYWQFVGTYLFLVAGAALTARLMLGWKLKANRE